MQQDEYLLLNESDLVEEIMRFCLSNVKDFKNIITTAELVLNEIKFEADNDGLRFRGFDGGKTSFFSVDFKKEYFDEIIKGRKKIEYRELKQTTLNRYTYLDESDGKRYLRRYDALRLFVGYHKDRESALVQVTDTTYQEGIVEYHLGLILEVI